MQPCAGNEKSTFCWPVDDVQLSIHLQRNPFVKLLHVVPSFGLGGMERVLCSVINALPGECQQSVLSLTGEQSASRWIQQQNITFVPFERPEGNVNYLQELFKKLKQWAPDVLMTYNWGATDAIWLGRLSGIQTILHSEHGFNVDEAASTQWKRNAIRYVVYRLTTRLIVVSQDLKKMMNTQFGIHDDRVLFIPNGIDTDYYAPHVYDREKMRDELGLQPTDLAIGYSGRLDPVKNFPFMMDVLKYCVHEDSGCKLVLIGDGPEKTFIDRFAREHGLQQHVICVGKKDQVLPYLQALDVFTLTSFREQMPMSMLEAMAVGIPVVAAAVGEIPTILKAQRAGLVFDTTQGVGPFSQGLLRMRDRETRQRMGQQARDLVVTRFQEQVMLRNYLDLFNVVAGENWAA